MRASRESTNPQVGRYEVGTLPSASAWGGRPPSRPPNDPARTKGLAARRVQPAHLGCEGVTRACGWESICLTGGAAAITGAECATSRPRSGRLAIGAGPRRSWSRTPGSRSVKSSARFGSSGRSIAWRRTEFDGEPGTGRAVHGEQEPLIRTGSHNERITRPKRGSLTVRLSTSTSPTRGPARPKGK